MRIIGIKMLNHDGSIAEIENQNILQVVELERISKIRYHFENPIVHPEVIEKWMSWYSQYREDKAPADYVVLENPLFEHRRLFLWQPTLQAYRKAMIKTGLATSKTRFTDCLHHMGHASVAYYSSPYESSLIFSFDGAGEDGTTNAYLGEGSKIRLFRKLPYWLGRVYKGQKDFLTDLKYSKAKGGEEACAGKIMALASYGKLRPEWVPLIDNYIATFHQYGSRILDDADFHRKVANVPDVIKAGVSVEGELGQDWLHTFQHTWSLFVQKQIEGLLKETGQKNLALSGGCALNCVANYDIHKNLHLSNIYVPPNPNDTGLSLGYALNFLHNTAGWSKRIEYPMSPFHNVRILDQRTPLLSDSRLHSKSVSVDEVVDHLIEGKIIGFIHGRSEMGPRALGNRSIICNPGIPGMRDILNAKVKFREWFRPFAPIVRVEDYQEYFDIQLESPYMSFAAPVRPAYREKLTEITHVDGSARLQTVQRSHNELVWQVLSRFKQKTGMGVLLNTSFNVKGLPILSSYKEAAEVLKETQLDMLYDGEMLFAKQPLNEAAALSTERA